MCTRRFSPTSKSARSLSHPRGEPAAFAMMRAQYSTPAAAHPSPVRASSGAAPTSSPARFTQRASSFLSKRSSGSAGSGGSAGRVTDGGRGDSVRSNGSGGGEYSRNADPGVLFVRQDRIGQSLARHSLLSTFRLAKHVKRDAPSGPNGRRAAEPCRDHSEHEAKQSLVARLRLFQVSPKANRFLPFYVHR